MSCPVNHKGSPQNESNIQNSFTKLFYWFTEHKSQNHKSNAGSHFWTQLTQSSANATSLKRVGNKDISIIIYILPNYNWKYYHILYEGTPKQVALCGFSGGEKREESFKIHKHLSDSLSQYTISHNQHKKELISA